MKRAKKVHVLTVIYHPYEVAVHGLRGDRECLRAFQVSEGAVLIPVPVIIHVMKTFTVGDEAGRGCSRTRRNEIRIAPS